MGARILYKPKKLKPLTKKEFDAAVARIRRNMSANVAAFQDNSNQASEKRKQECKEDFEKFKMTYLPHYFYKPSGEIHNELHEICSTGNKSINAVAYPRDHGKSVNCTFAELIYKAVYLKSRYGIIIADTLSLGEEFLFWIRLEFEENERLRQDFGVEGELRTEGWWVKDDIVITTASGQARIRAMGAGMKVRGTRFMMWRPMYIVIDDLENNINVRNKKLVEERFQWILGAVYGSMDDEGTLIMIGTMLALISVLSKLIKHIREKKEEIEKEFGIKVMNAVVYSAIKPDGTALWPEGKSLKKLLQIKKMVSYRVWMCEFQNDPPDAGEFKLAWMKTFDPVILIPNKYIYFTGSDVSADEGEENDFKSHVVIALNQELDKRYTVEAWIRHTVFSTFYMAFIQIFQEYDPVQSAFETNGFQRVVKRELDRLCKQKKVYPNIREVVHTTNKFNRIISWQAMVERADILFSIYGRDMELLKHQLNQLGTKEHDDGPDAWDMALDLSINYGGDFDYESAGERATQYIQREYETIGSGNERFGASIWSQFRI
jgi:hypothetical protein